MFCLITRASLSFQSLWGSPLWLLDWLTADNPWSLMSFIIMIWAAWRTKSQSSCLLLSRRSLHFLIVFAESLCLLITVCANMWSGSLCPWKIGLLIRSESSLAFCCLTVRVKSVYLKLAIITKAIVRSHILTTPWLLIKPLLLRISRLRLRLSQRLTAF